MKGIEQEFGGARRAPDHAGLLGENKGLTRWAPGGTLHNNVCYHFTLPCALLLL